MRLILSIAAVIVTVLLSSVFAADEKRPPHGLVYDANESDENRRGLRFTCSNTAYNELECEFSSIYIVKKAKPSELNKALEEVRQQFRTGQKDQPKQMDCSKIEDMLADLRGSSSKIK